PEPPPVTPSRKLPPRFGLVDVVAVFGEAPHAANGPTSIAPPTTIPLLMSSRRRDIVDVKGFFGSGLGLSSIASFFLLLLSGRVDYSCFSSRTERRRCSATMSGVFVSRRRSASISFS